MTSAANQRPVLWVFGPIRRQETGAGSLDCGLLVCHHEPLWKSGNYLMMTSFMTMNGVQVQSLVWIITEKKGALSETVLISSTTEFYIRLITGKLSVLLSGHLHSFLPTLSKTIQPNKTHRNRNRHHLWPNLFSWAKQQAGLSLVAVTGAGARSGERRPQSTDTTRPGDIRGCQQKQTILITIVSNVKSLQTSIMMF